MPTTPAEFGAQITQVDADLVGPWRRPRQMLAHQTFAARGSIHDDDVARAHGFQAGTIEGPTHFTPFEPLCAATWGDRWFREGCLSAHFTNPVFEGEATQAQLTPRGDTGRVRMVKIGGEQVLSGTAHVGPGHGSELHHRLAALRPPGDLRILAGASVGARTPRRPSRLAWDRPIAPAYPFSVREKLAALTEPGWPFDGQSAALPLELVSVLFCQHELTADWAPAEAVGLFADQEIRLFEGPLYAETDYEISRELLAVSSGRRTESLWIRAEAYAPGGAAPLAAMLINCAYLRPLQGP